MTSDPPKANGSDKPSSPSGPANDAWSYAGVGLEFAAAVAVCVFGGLWLDGRLHTVVLFTLVGLAVGFTVGMYSMIRVLHRKRNRRQ